MSGGATMIGHIRKNTVPITIGVAGYVFGFFVMANVLALTDRDVVVGLIAGSVGGITILISMLWQERKAAQPQADASVSPASVR
jgi:hypothetical protein